MIPPLIKLNYTCSSLLKLVYKLEKKNDNMVNTVSNYCSKYVIKYTTVFTWMIKKTNKIKQIKTLNKF